MVRLVALDVDTAATAIRVNGKVVVTNECNEPMALLTSPIDTRAAVTDAWEKSLSSVYARFEVFDTIPTPDPPFP